MFPLMGSIRQPGGNEFPFIIFSLAVLAQVGLAIPWLEQYVRRPYPYLWWLSRKKGVLESPPTSKSKRLAVPELRLSSVWFHFSAFCTAGTIVAPAGASSSAAPWVLVLPKGVKVISAPSQAALLGDHLGVAFLPRGLPYRISRSAAADGAGWGSVQELRQFGKHGNEQ